MSITFQNNLRFPWKLNKIMSHVISETEKLPDYLKSKIFYNYSLIPFTSIQNFHRTWMLWMLSLHHIRMVVCYKLLWCNKQIQRIYNAWYCIFFLYVTHVCMIKKRGIRSISVIFISDIIWVMWPMPSHWKNKELSLITKKTPSQENRGKNQ